MSLNVIKKTLNPTSFKHVKVSAKLAIAQHARMKVSPNKPVEGFKLVRTLKNFKTWSLYNLPWVFRHPC